MFVGKLFGFVLYPEIVLIGWLVGLLEWVVGGNGGVWHWVFRMVFLDCMYR